MLGPTGDYAVKDIAKIKRENKNFKFPKIESEL
jgi:hypothetical protein